MVLGGLIFIIEGQKLGLRRRLDMEEVGNLAKTTLEEIRKGL